MNTYERKAAATTLLRRPSWLLALGLAGVALVRPLFSITGLSDSLGKPATPLILTAVISLVWIAAGTLRRVREPLPTLVAAGLAYGLAGIVLSGILSPLLDGEPDGPLAHPQAIIPVLLVNAAWGAVCGACALGLRRLRGQR
ncbi:hypothetical protein [Streptomyces sp. TRM68367]|uniref:hypothetical protein n=1 Tax=Streptomyces sp. TRM68367 TaxID=2758415 RepID=UPI00165CECA5|nr:hypothetical protein [Streptomyces sp. TRM68367]MBC9727283.1 hypothetical protein [Streptomyces sp. TRM68367]